MEFGSSLSVQWRPCRGHTFIRFEMAPTNVWQHSMGDIVNALIGAGLAIEWLHEFPLCAWKVVAGCEVVERSVAGQVYYGRPASEMQLPLMFSIRARAG
jgi:hypothetical protein